MQVDLYNQSGEKCGKLELPKNIFELPFNQDLIHQALKMQLANRRVAIAHTKTRGFVSGGGRKPFKQKGTGNARQGSIRAPQMRHGAVIFGPSNRRNFTLNMPKKQRKLALFSALSEKARHNQILGLESYEADKPKTKDFSLMLRKLPIERDVLVVLPERNTLIQKSVNNIPFAKSITVNYLNIHDLQRFEKILFLKEAVTKIK